MIKQIYRFLSVLLISNLIFSPAGLTKSQKNTESFSATVCQNNDKANNTDNEEPVNNQDPINRDPNLEKMPPYNDDSGKFTTLYGVQIIDDIYRTYPSPNDQ